MSWWNWNGIPARVILKLDEVADNGDLLFGSSPDARFPCTVYQLLSGNNDYTSDIPCRYTTPLVDMGTPWAIKRFKSLTLDCDDFDGGVGVSWDVDNGRRTGAFEIQPKATMCWGNATDKIKKMWNDSTGSQVNGLWWTERKAKPLVGRFPQSCLGRLIKLTFFTTSTGSTPFKILKFAVEFSTVKELYPSSTQGGS